MSPDRIAIVEWTDSAVMASTWRDTSDAVEASRRSMVEPIISCGLVIADEPTHLLLAVSHNGSIDDVQGAIVIPRHAIVRLATLELAAIVAPA